MQFGIYTIQRLVAVNEKNDKVFIDFLDELYLDAYGGVEYLSSLYEVQMAQEWTESRLDFDADGMRTYAKRQFEIRKGQVNRAKDYSSAEELDAHLTQRAKKREADATKT